MFNFEPKLINECHISIVICLNHWNPLLNWCPKLFILCLYPSKSLDFPCHNTLPHVSQQHGCKSGNGTIGGTLKKDSFAMNFEYPHLNHHQNSSGGSHRGGGTRTTTNIFPTPIMSIVGSWRRRGRNSTPLSKKTTVRGKC